MCRLVAFSSESQPSPDGIFIFGSLMLLSERKNNKDGAGVAVNRTAEPAWFKAGKPAHVTVFGKGWKEWFEGVNSYDTIIGHTRLASLEWKDTAGKDGTFPTRNAHPFAFGQIIGAHNGSFKEWETNIAPQVGKHDDYIDTQYFFHLLQTRAEGGLTLDTIIECLKQVGEAKYSMLIQHVSSPEVHVIRGNAPLYCAETNYGLVVNTERENLVDLPDYVNHAFAHWGRTPLQMKTPTFLPQYTAYTLSGGVLTRGRDFEREVKDINEPKVVTTYSWGGWAGHQSSTETSTGKETLDGTEIVLRAAGLSELRQINPAASDEDFRLTAVDLWGKEVSDLAWLESEQLFYLAELLRWASETDGEIYAPTAEKCTLWFEYCSALYNIKPGIPAQEEYRLTEVILGEGRIDPPFWHNPIGVLQELVEKVKEEGVPIG